MSRYPSSWLGSLIGIIEIEMDFNWDYLISREKSANCNFVDLFMRSIGANNLPECIVVNGLGRGAVED